MPLYRISRIIALLVFAALLASLWGCRSTSDTRRAERAPTERRVLRTASAPPTAEQLRDSPCGNPEWAKLPGLAGEEADEEDELPTGDDQPAGDQPGDEQPGTGGGEQPSTDDQPGDDQPGDDQPGGEQAYLMAPCP